MKKITLRSAVFGLLFSFVLLIGCEFETGGSGGFNTALFGWVNFSGVYRASESNLLVSAFTTTSSSSNDSGQTSSVTGEFVGPADGVTTYFEGTLANFPVVPGSVSFRFIGAELLSDDGNGALVGSGGGIIDYVTGNYTIDLDEVITSEVFTLNVNYMFSDAGGGSGGTDAGSSVVEIHQFTVFQTGNVLEIVDNNGARYAGQFGKVETTGGVGGDDINADPPAQPASGDTAVAEFTAEGLSASGIHVLMVGTFQGVVAGNSLTGRRIVGTWIETGGVTGNIDGQAAALAL
jgi:hypothetical protein